MIVKFWGGKVYTEIVNLGTVELNIFGIINKRGVQRRIGEGAGKKIEN